MTGLIRGEFVGVEVVEFEFELEFEFTLELGVEFRILLFEALLDSFLNKGIVLISQGGGGRI